MQLDGRVPIPRSETKHDIHVIDIRYPKCCTLLRGRNQTSQFNVGSEQADPSLDVQWPDLQVVERASRRHLRHTSPDAISGFREFDSACSRLRSLRPHQEACGHHLFACDDSCAGANTLTYEIAR